MCDCKTMSFTVLVTVPTSYGDAKHAADNMRETLEAMEYDIVTNASLRVTTDEPMAADRAACLAGVCKQ